MLQEQSRLFQRILFFADAAFVALAWVTAFVLRFQAMPALAAWGIGPAWFVPPEPVAFGQYVWMLPWVLLGACAVFYASGLYGADRALNLFRLAWSVARAALFSFVLVSAAVTFNQAFYVSRLFLVAFGVVLCVLLIGARAGLFATFRRRRHVRRVLVVGAGKSGHRLAETLRAYPWAHVEIAGFLDDNPDADVPDGTRVLGRAHEAPLVLDRYDADGQRIHDVYLALPLAAAPLLEGLLAELSTRTAHVYFVPDLFGFEVLNARVSDLDGLPVLHLIDEVPFQFSWVAKRAIDVAFSAGVLLLLSPILAALAVGVKLSSPGPVFYRQERLSLNGQRFWMLKFRSMPVDAEAGTGAVWARAGEVRATRFGAFLRRTSLDELPQFFNVLRGEMSVVGPRPERPVFVEQFRNEVPRYMLKHKVPAGITGWAQVHGWRGSTSLEKRIEYDLYYIQNWSLRLDLKIMVMTVWKGFVHRNAY